MAKKTKKGAKAKAIETTVGDVIETTYGYTPQSQNAVDIVNEHKQVEERLLRRLDALYSAAEFYDRRFLSIAQTHFEQGFMALNRAVFKPKRIMLPEDKKD